MLVPASWILSTALSLQAAISADSVIALTRDGSPDALSAVVRQNPDRAREALSSLLGHSAGAGPGLTEPLRTAERLAAAYAQVWGDSFPAKQVERFVSWSPRRRQAKLRADSLRRAGNDAYRETGVDAAIRIWRSSLAAAASAEDSAGMGAAVGNIGAGFYRAGMMDSAAVYLERADVLASAVGDRRTAANARTNLASVARARGRLAEARRLYKISLADRERIGDLRGQAADLQNLGLIAQDLGDLQGAERAFEEALALNVRTDRQLPAATNRVNLANLASVAGRYDEADRLYKAALEAYRSAGSRLDAADVLHNLGNLQVRRGDYRAAIASLLDARELYRGSGLSSEESLVRLDLSAAHAAAGNLQEAIDWLGDARTAPRAQRVGATVRARLALASGDLELRLNRLGEARREFESAERLFRAEGDLQGVADAQLGQAFLFVLQGAESQALEQYRRTLATFERTGDPRAVAVAKLFVAHGHGRAGEDVSARLIVQEALEAFRSVGDPVGQAAALSMLGDLELSLGAPARAEELYAEGIALVDGGQAPDVSWQLHAGRGRALQELVSDERAVSELRLAIDEIEQTSRGLTLVETQSDYLADKWEVYARLAEMEHDRGDVAAAFEVSERLRARRVVELLDRGRVLKGSEVAEALIGREQDLRWRIRQLTRETRTTTSMGTRRDAPAVDRAALNFTDALRDARKEYSELIAQLRREMPELATLVGAAVARVGEVRARLSTDELMLEYLIGDSTAIVLAVGHDTVWSADLEATRPAIASLIDFTRGVVADLEPRGEREIWRAPLARLYRLLIGPIADAGLLDGKRRLIIVPHAELHYLPFQALIGDDASFLVERFEILYAPSGTVWLQLAERQSVATYDRVLVLAPNIERLPASLAEVEGIREIYGDHATVLARDDAREDRFVTLAGTPDVVHLATFGYLNKTNPLFSFVELAPGGGHDGRLEVHEVFGIDLKASLVVLSACETALGAGYLSEVPAGDDWIGLVRAFLSAGSSNVMATLWLVEDEPTAELIVGFYRRLSMRQDPVAALAEAQRAAIADPNRSHPYYWAGFALVGRG